MLWQRIIIRPGHALTKTHRLSRKIAASRIRNRQYRHNPMQLRHEFGSEGKHRERSYGNKDDASSIVPAAAARGAAAAGPIAEGQFSACVRPEIFRHETAPDAGRGHGRAVVLHADVAEPAKNHQPDYPFPGLD